MTLAALTAVMVAGGVVAATAVHATVVGDDKVLPVSDDMTI